MALVLVLMNISRPEIDGAQKSDDFQDRYVNFMVQRQVVYEQKMAERHKQTSAAESGTSTRAAPADAASSPSENVSTSDEASERGGGEPAETPGGGTYRRSRTRDQIVKDASKVGILGLITSGSGGSNATDIESLLGEGAKTQEIEEVLSGLDAVRSRESAGGREEGGREVRGERTTDGGGIEGLVKELGDAKSTNIARTGELVVDEISALEKEGEVTKLAGRNPDDVSGVINSHLGAIQNLYQLELRRNPNLRGKLVVRFTINPQGKITKVTVVSSTLNDEQLVNRIKRRMLRWDDFGPVAPEMGDAVFRQVFTFGF